MRTDGKIGVTVFFIMACLVFQGCRSSEDKSNLRGEQASVQAVEEKKIPLENLLRELGYTPLETLGKSVVIKADDGSGKFMLTEFDELQEGDLKVLVYSNAIIVVNESTNK